MSGANPQRRRHESREIRLVEERYNETEGERENKDGGLKNKGIKNIYGRLPA